MRDHAKAAKDLRSLPCNRKQCMMTISQLWRGCRPHTPTARVSRGTATVNCCTPPWFRCNGVGEVPGHVDGELESRLGAGADFQLHALGPRILLLRCAASWHSSRTNDLPELVCLRLPIPRRDWPVRCATAKRMRRQNGVIRRRLIRQLLINVCTCTRGNVEVSVCRGRPSSSSSGFGESPPPCAQGRIPGRWHAN